MPIGWIVEPRDSYKAYSAVTELIPIECTCWPINFGDGSVVTG